MNENVIFVSLNLVSYSSIHFPANNVISFFLIAESHLVVYLCHIFFIHLLVVGHLG
jgi:hypothetical protein